MGPAF